MRASILQAASSLYDDGSDLSVGRTVAGGLVMSVE
jgi:hypothetical protein